MEIQVGKQWVYVLNICIILALLATECGRELGRTRMHFASDLPARNGIQSSMQLLKLKLALLTSVQVPLHTTRANNVLSLKWNVNPFLIP